MRRPWTTVGFCAKIKINIVPKFKLENFAVRNI
jgi:hypothetical protein